MENIQKIRRIVQTPIDGAISYFRILATANEISLSKREAQLLGFLIVSREGFSKNRFMEEFDCSEPTVNNLVCALRKKGFLVKDSKTPKLQPILLKLDFNHPATLAINLVYE